jgi:predicted ATPase
LAVEEERGGPIVVDEWLRWRRNQAGRPFKFLTFQRGAGEVVSGEAPDETDERFPERLASPDLLAVSTLGQLAQHPRVGALRHFVTSWYVSYLAAGDMRGTPDAGPAERLTPTGDNLPNVIQYLKEQHPTQLDEILRILVERVPRLERVLAEPMPNGQLLLRIKDAPFEQPILAKYASDGTLKMLAYLIVLHDPSPPQFIGIEEPENYLHPRLLPELAEECRRATAATQLLVTSHSPYFVNEIRPEELRVLYRDDDGYTQVHRVADMERATAMYQAGGKLGQLWLEGYFDVGDPLVRAGGPIQPRGRRGR